MGLLYVGELGVSSVEGLMQAVAAVTPLVVPPVAVEELPVAPEGGLADVVLIVVV